MRPKRNYQRKPLAGQTHAVAKKLANRDLGEVRQLRYVETHFHNGMQWTVDAKWEKFSNGQWREVPWTELDF